MTFCRSTLKARVVGCCAAIAIPFGDPKAWTELEFRKIPPNQVTFSGEGIAIKVKESASPLVYKLPKIVLISQVEVELEINGELKPQSAGFAEDSAFRLGLVAAGKQTLSRIQKLFAPAWVEKLFSLAPAGVGLDKIYFLNVGEEDQQIGQLRIHPKSELMSEEIVTLRKKGQRQIRFTKAFDPALSTAALWISVDGDDTKSEFTTTVRKISLTATSL